jgi:hypothetical protein
MAADRQGLLSSSKNPDVLWGPPTLLFDRLRRQERGADHSPSRSGAIPAPPFMPWTAADGVVRCGVATVPSTARLLLGMEWVVHLPT